MKRNTQPPLINLSDGDMIAQNEQKVNKIEEFTKHKIFAKELQNILSSFYKDASAENELSKKSESILKCGSNLFFEHFFDENNTTRLAGANFCKHRLCPYCAWRWHIKYAKIIEKTFEILGQKEFYHLVLTIPNVKYINKEFLINLRQNSTEFMKKTLKCEDYLISFEITIGKDGTFHPHYHILCILKDKPTRKFLQTEWAKVANCGKYAICDIKKCTDNKISQELTKYILKFESDKIEESKIFIINKALKGLRKFATNGIIKKAEKTAKRQLQAEIFDKIQELQEYDSEILFYKWIGQSYFLENTQKLSKENRTIDTSHTEFI